MFIKSPQPTFQLETSTYILCKVFGVVKRGCVNSGATWEINAEPAFDKWSCPLLGKSACDHVGGRGMQRP